MDEAVCHYYFVSQNWCWGFIIVDMEQSQFPNGFFFGAATSAHQVEGNTKNDWTEWEHMNSARLAAEAARRHANASARIPDYILKNYPNPLQEENYISGKACDHYNRFREDFDIAKQLGHNAHRFSIEWSRIEPEEGVFDEKEIAHYRVVIEALRERGLEPFVTLWHWTLPQWFSAKGGWEYPDARECFLRYVNKAVRSLEGVNYWMTMNEPETFARHGYLLGDRPPSGKWNIVKAYGVLKNLTAAHAAAYRAIKSIDASLQVGFAENLVHFEPYSRWPQNVLAVKLLRWWRNNPFFGEYARHCDFIGLQHYFHSRIRVNLFLSRWGIQYNENKKVSDMGWEIYPESIYHVLRELAAFKKPIIITENGLADARDIYRADFIREYLSWTARAMKEGTDVRGYFYWSLLDNFEWNEGYWPRFGLVEIDYKTQERKLRPSALTYKQIIENARK